MKFVELAGRILYSFIFLHTLMNHFSKGAISYAALSGVPVAEVLVPLSGIFAIVGSISIILGYKAKWGAWFIVGFLIPVTLFMHAFWKETDPMKIQIQMIHFMKNVSMLGGALIITYYGAGPLSLDTRIKTVDQKKNITP